MAKKKTPRPKTNNTPETAIQEKSRQLKPAGYRSFRLQKRIKADEPLVLGGFQIFKQSLSLLKPNWKPFLGIALVYGVLNVILVQSFSTLNISDTKEALEGAFAGDWNQFMSGFSLFAYLVGTSASTNTQTAGAYQFILLLVTSLATIWTLRQVYQGHRIRVRDAYYQGMYPIIPFTLVVATIAIQMIPLALGSYLYSFAIGPGPLSATEMLLWLTAIGMLAILSFYLISSTLFALYIVCLPNVAPMTAIRSARTLVRHRRWTVMRRIFFLPFILFLIGAVIMIPVIIFLTPAAVWIFFLLSMLVIPLIHGYMYRLYRELL